MKHIWNSIERAIGKFIHQKYITEAWCLTLQGCWIWMGLALINFLLIGIYPNVFGEWDEVLRLGLLLVFIACTLLTYIKMCYNLSCYDKAVNAFRQPDQPDHARKASWFLGFCERRPSDTPFQKQTVLIEITSGRQTLSAILQEINIANTLRSWRLKVESQRPKPPRKHRRKVDPNQLDLFGETRC